jgi:RimJ/RimL family protein N-acetyltransferase
MARVASAAGRASEEPNRCFAFAVVRAEDDLVIGRLSVERDRSHPAIAWITFVEIADEYQHHGHGRGALSLATGWAARLEGVQHVRAEILEANVASRRTFAASGYARTAELAGQVWEWTPA